LHGAARGNSGIEEGAETEGAVGVDIDAARGHASQRHAVRNLVVKAIDDATNGLRKSLRLEMRPLLARYIHGEK
jgi:hypothetical protein